MKALISGVLSHNLCTVEETLATIVFDHSCHYSAAMLFHLLALAFPPAVAPDRCLPRIAIELTRHAAIDLLNSGHLAASCSINLVSPLPMRITSFQIRPSVQT